MSSSPGGPMTELEAGAAQVHELYQAYLTAGFSEQQAMRLVVAIVTAGMRGGG